MSQDKRELLIEIAWTHLNKPYRWGGDNPNEGFDCSGLIVEIFKSAGILPRKGDWTAHDLAKKFEVTEVLREGVLLFYDWNNDGIIDHVEMIMALDSTGEIFALGASGGDSSTVDDEIAEKQNAYVKIRPMQEGALFATDPLL